MVILPFSISFVCLVVIHLILCFIPLSDSAAAHSPSGKGLNTSSQEDAHFSRRFTSTNSFTLSCVIPLWDSATAHSPSSKELNPSCQEDSRFSRRCTLTYNFHFILGHLSLELSNSSVTLQ